MIALFVCTGGFAQENSKLKTLVIKDVAVIDGTGAAEQSGMTVVIVGGRISDIGVAAKISVPESAIIVDGKGKYLIPGLWDMHVHWYDPRYLPLFVTNGVTGVRVMWGTPDHYAWRKAEADGSLIGPRLVIGSTIIDGPNPIWPGSVSVKTAEEGRKAVTQEKANGAEFIKVYSLLPRDAYFAIADEAKKKGIPFAGHVPNSVTAAEASAAGQKSIEHLTGLLLACSTSEDRIRSEYASSVEKGRDAVLRFVRANAKELLSSYSDKKAKDLFSVFAKNNTWQCPTLTVLRSFAYMDDPALTNDARVKYMPKSLVAQWNPQNDARLTGQTPEDYSNAKQVFERQLKLVAGMQHAGVKLLAGTDVMNPYCFPGFSLHDELALMVRAGLTPMEALRTATYNPAAYLGKLDSLGTIEKGKIADLVLLNADPLQDINNTKQIDAVIQGGRLFSKSELSEMQSAVEKIAGKTSIAFVLAETIQSGGIEEAVAQYHKLKETASEEYEFGESELNTLGYQIIGAKRYKDAIEILKLNVEAFPDSGNAYDSLAEAYMLSGEKEASIANYKKSLELDPKNENARQKLKSLEQ